MLGYKKISYPEDECSRDAHASWMCGNMRRDKMRNEDIRTKIGVASISYRITSIHVFFGLPFALLTCPKLIRSIRLTDAFVGLRLT